MCARMHAWLNRDLLVFLGGLCTTGWRERGCWFRSWKWITWRRCKWLSSGRRWRRDLLNDWPHSPFSSFSRSLSRLSALIFLFCRVYNWIKCNYTELFVSILLSLYEIDANICQSTHCSPLNAKQHVLCYWSVAVEEGKAKRCYLSSIREDLWQNNYRFIARGRIAFLWTW